jgi:hypothetical protein
MILKNNKLTVPLTVPLTVAMKQELEDMAIAIARPMTITARMCLLIGLRQLQAEHIAKVEKESK